MPIAERLPANRPAQPEILGKILEYSIEETRDNIGLEPVYGLQDHLKYSLKDRHEWLNRGLTAANIAERYHSELITDEQHLTRQERSNLALSRLYLSNISALGHLRQLTHARFWLNKKDPAFQESKVSYLEARKVAQDDVDNYFRQFEHVAAPVRNETLIDVANMARLLVSNNEWVSAETDTYTHQFIGSILSERLVKVSLQKYVNPEARYGTAEEDSSPTKADVVLPLPQGDMHVQVKMKWMEPTEMEIKPKPKRMHVIVPMHAIRGGLTKVEHRRLKSSIRERLAELAIQSLQTEVDGVELAA
ncbi:MAG TPA: hypothetical protein VFW52_00170 [Candidatus Saccharimonadales bacterium]|nr:hypothetical protein [Candidatus Saccharimonadales bacterium]